MRRRGRRFGSPLPALARRFRCLPVLGHTHPMAWTGEFTATQIAAAVRDGSQSATAAVTESLRRIAERDPEVRAFVIVRGESALAEAAEVDQPTRPGDAPIGRGSGG